MAPVAADEWVDVDDDQWEDVPAAAPRPTAPPPRAQSFAEKASTLNPGNIIAGQLKGIGSTAYNLYKGVANTIQGQPADTVRSPEIEAALEPSNAGQRLGRFTEQGAEFMAGEGAVARGLTKIAPALTKIPKMARTASAAISGAGVTKAQGGTDQEAVVNAATGAVLPALFEGTAKFMKALGAKMQMSLMRPTSADIAAGFKPENVDAYDVGRATLPRALKAVNEKITKLATELRSITANSPGTVDLTQALSDVEQELLSRAGRIKSPGDATAIRNAIDRFKEDAAAIGNAVSVDEAQTLKRAVGLKGAWSYGKTDADKAMEAVANTYYSKLKNAIEQATPPELIAINKQLGDLMPIEQAIVRRIPVKMRESPLSLSDLVLLAHGHPIGALMHVASKTGVMAGVPAAIGSGMRTASRPLTATIQELNTSKKSDAPKPKLGSILKQEPTERTAGMRGPEMKQSSPGGPAGSPVLNRTSGRDMAEWPVPANRVANENEQLLADRTPAQLLPSRFTNARQVRYGEPRSGNISTTVPEAPSDAYAVYGTQFVTGPQSGRMGTEYDNSILVNPQAQDMTDVLAHETFHAVWNKDLVPQEQAQFRALYDGAIEDVRRQAAAAGIRPGTPGAAEKVAELAKRMLPAAIYASLSDQGATDSSVRYDEAFSELGGQYMMNPTKFRETYPKIYGWYRQLVGTEYTVPKEKRFVPIGPLRNKPHWEYPGGM